MSDNNSNNQNANSGNGGATGVSWGSKVGYIGVGVIIGLVAYPFVRRTISQLQPKMDKLFDNLTGKAENLAEKASDLFAKAKHSFAQQEAAGGGGHVHEDHAHPHPQDPSNGGREA